MAKNVFYGMALPQKYIAIYGRIRTGFAIKYIFCHFLIRTGFLKNGNAIWHCHAIKTHQFE